MGVVTHQMDYAQLVGLVGDETALSVWEVKKDIVAYTHFKSAIDLGISISLSEIPFERAMVFSWIKGELDGRKNRV